MNSLTSNLNELVNDYSRRARLYPAILAVLPILPYLLLALHEVRAVTTPRGWVDLLWPVLVTAGVPFLATNLVRSLGKAAQERLVTAWGGLPTTRALRHRDTGSPERREHRRRRLEELLSTRLPTVDHEAQDPAAADQRYVLAVEQLVTRVRARRDSFPLVGEENAAYGFRRNLIGVKPWALTLLMLCLVADIAMLAGALTTIRPPHDLLILLVAVHGAASLGWLAGVRRSWVHEAANDYASSLFATLDDSRL